ncbi:hypothetical protein N0V85_002383 [Neurospora sp. IMI 360204]|nr:hypothetical protein N0V85_002383 [Neurospora sp. IMI 360204]
MFFTGTLQEGIAAAIQQTKSLVCFVTDDNTESQQWETEFLNDEAISPLIESSAVVLKLVAGSTEEGYLAQLFPVPKKPTVVVLRGGQLKEYIAAGVTKEEFVRRLRAALGEQQAVSTGATPGSASVQESQSEQGPEQASSEPAPQPSAEQTTAPVTSSIEASTSQQPSTSTTTTTEPTTASSSSPATTTTTTTTNTTQQAQIQAILTERAARLAAQKKQQEESARAAARARAAAEDPNSPARQAADALRKKQQEAREERQRILKAIEDDKAARRARQSEKQREKEALSAKETGESKEDKGEGLPFAPASPMLPRGNQPVKSTGHCALQVRLTDGSTIRAQFSAERDTVREVREWVEATVPSNDSAKKGRYSFKVLLTPQPSRRIEKEEEGKTLGELGLAPSSTLILVPTAGGSGSSGARVSFATAQGGEGGGNIFQRLIGFLVGFFNTVVAFFSTLFSVSGPPNAGPTPEQVAAEVRGEQQAASRAERASGRSLGGGGAGAAVNRGTGSRIKGFGDERRDEERKRNDQQFYNGNSTNFEPRHDDDEN